MAEPIMQVTTLLLDKMRRIKNRMVRLKTRVETIRELLEKFLEDEGDMKSMNLTARQDLQAAAQATAQTCLTALAVIECYMLTKSSKLAILRTSKHQILISSQSDVLAVFWT